MLLIQGLSALIVVFAHMQIYAIYVELKNSITPKALYFHNASFDL